MELRTKVAESALKADRLTIFNVPAVVSRLYAAHNDQKSVSLLKYNVRWHFGVMFWQRKIEIRLICQMPCCSLVRDKFGSFH